MRGGRGGSSDELVSAVDVFSMTMCDENTGIALGLPWGPRTLGTVTGHAHATIHEKRTLRGRVPVTLVTQFGEHAKARSGVAIAPSHPQPTAMCRHADVPAGAIASSQARSGYSCMDKRRQTHAAMTAMHGCRWGYGVGQSRSSPRLLASPDRGGRKPCDRNVIGLSALGGRCLRGGDGRSMCEGQRSWRAHASRRQSLGAGEEEAVVVDKGTGRDEVIRGRRRRRGEGEERGRQLGSISRKE